MASVTITEVLRRAQDYEARLEHFYAELRDATSDNGVRLLTYYLSRHRHRLDRALDAVDPKERERIDEVRLKVDIPFHPSPALIETPVPEITGQSLLAAAVDHDTQLVGLYHAVAGQAIGDEAGRLIESLIRLEEKDIVMLKKMMAMNYF